MSIVEAIPGVRVVYSWLRNRLAAEQQRREANGTVEILDGLRHAHFENGKYLVSLILRSGHIVSGFVGGNIDYVHKSYSGSRGFIELVPVGPGPVGVHYENIVVRLSTIDGYLLQNVYGLGEDEVTLIAQGAYKRIAVR
nr:hypothetical protein [uncultured Sphingomonas sp.]